MTNIAKQVPWPEDPANGSLTVRAGGGEQPPCQFEMHISDQDDPNGRKPETTRTAGSLAPSGQDGPRGTHGRLLQSCPQRRARQPWAGAERMCGLLLNVVKELQEDCEQLARYIQWRKDREGASRSTLTVTPPARAGPRWASSGPKR